MSLLYIHIYGYIQGKVKQRPRVVTQNPKRRSLLSNMAFTTTTTVVIKILYTIHRDSSLWSSSIQIQLPWRQHRGHKIARVLALWMSDLLPHLTTTCLWRGFMYSPSDLQAVFWLVSVWSSAYLECRAESSPISSFFSLGFCVLHLLLSFFEFFSLKGVSIESLSIYHPTPCVFVSVCVCVLVHRTQSSQCPVHCMAFYSYLTVLMVHIGMEAMHCAGSKARTTMDSCHVTSPIHMLTTICISTLLA